jgi:hypothetical protein
VSGTREARAAGLDLDHAVDMVRSRTLARYAVLQPDADPALAARFERMTGPALNVQGIRGWLDKLEPATG